MVVVVVVVVVLGSLPGSQSQHSSWLHSAVAHVITAKFGFGLRPSRDLQSAFEHAEMQGLSLDVNVVPTNGELSHVSHVS